ncbi:hypothetical protein KAZ66_01240, partial [Candidatus Woesebacteria bacterium]|nr:hypothetical protein [Candidatus Woesebacteria bacterium]
IYIKGIITLKQSLLISCFLFLAFGTKFYVAFTILLIVGFNEIWILIQYKQWRNFIRNCFFFLLSTGMAVILFYNPFNTTKTGSIFIFSPFATVHHLIETPTLFHLPNMVLARYYLYEHGWSPRLYGIELFSTFLFALFYFGTRFIGFIQILKLYLLKKADRMTVIISLVIIILITCAVLFIQKGDWYNPIQFAVPAAFLLNIFTAQLLHDIFKKQKTMGILVIILFVSLTLPANFVNAGYLQNPARLVIPEKEMEALTFLRDQPNGSVFVPIEENAESDTAYVSAFTSKPTYVNFTNVLQNADIPYEKRLSEVSDLKTADIAIIDADYMYLALNRKQNIDFYNRIKNSAKLNEIFNNKTVIIYSLKKTK